MFLGVVGVGFGFGLDPSLSSESCDLQLDVGLGFALGLGLGLGFTVTIIVRVRVRVIVSVRFGGVCIDFGVGSPHPPVASTRQPEEYTCTVTANGSLRSTRVRLQQTAA